MSIIVVCGNRLSDNDCDVMMCYDYGSKVRTFPLAGRDLISHSHVETAFHGSDRA